MASIRLAARRLALAAVALLVTALVAEGVLSLSGQPGLASLLGQSSPSFSVFPPGEDPRLLMPPGTLFVAHPDPRVSHTLRRNAELEFLGIPLRSDELGLRARLGAEPGPDPFRIAVLGDSVAFGWRLPDEATLASQLERLIATAERPVACRTVALPAWNFDDASSFLFDHFDALDPDLVVYVPTPNDLADQDVAYQRAVVRRPPDITAADPWFNVSYNGAFLMRLLDRRLAGEVEIAKARSGPVALESDLSSESSRRYDELADGIVAMERRLRRMDCRSILACPERTPFEAILRERLLARTGRPGLVALIDDLTTEDALSTSDAHPDAECVSSLALLLAHELALRSLVPGLERDDLPAVPDELRARRARVPRPEEVGPAASRARDAALEILQERIETGTGRGAQQVYGGLLADGCVDTRLLAVVARTGEELRVTLAPLEDRPDLAPVVVTILGDGEALGTMTLRPGAALSRVFPVPSIASGAGRALEVKLVPDRWGARSSGDDLELASFRLVAVGFYEP